MPAAKPAFTARAAGPVFMGYPSDGVGRIHGGLSTKGSLFKHFTFWTFPARSELGYAVRLMWFTTAGSQNLATCWCRQH
eukprot:6485822-Amphidinium_carterae.1